MKKLKHILDLIRWKNILIIVLCQVSIVLFILDKDITMLYRPIFLFILLSTVLIASAGNVINDYYDVKIDAINKPSRVKVGQKVSRFSTISIHFVLNVLALVLAFYVSYKLFLLDLLIIFLLWLYSWRLKCTPFIGNLLVAILTSMVIVILGIYFGFNNKMYSYVFFAFFLSLIREIVKDLEDVEGDNSFDCKTLPIAIGRARSIVLVQLFSFIYILAALFVLYISKDVYFKIAFFFLAISPSLFYIVFTFQAKEKKDFKKISNFIKITMIGGLITTLFL